MTTTTTARHDGGTGRHEAQPAPRPRPTTEAPADTDAPAETEAPADTEAPDGHRGAGDTVDPASIETDIGVDDTTIKIGLNADLSGIFAPLVTQIVDGQEAYWEIVNDNGGIAGRQVELVVLDNGYDVPKHLENYEVMSGDGDEGVVIFSQSTGSPHTTATADLLVEDDLIAIPLSWYSGWPDPAIGQNVFEAYTSYCVESMNGVSFMAENFDAQTIAIIGFPGEYGQDGSAGAKIAAEALGLEVVYDGEARGRARRRPDPGDHRARQRPTGHRVGDANPTTFAEIMGSAVAQGLQAQWSGNSPTYNFQLLGTELAPVLDQYYTHSTYTQLWNSADVPGMTEVVEGMREKRPDAPVSDVYIVAWTEGYITQQILEQAARNGDMTRAGVVAAANEITADLKGLAPDQTWAGEPNDYIVRESYMYDVVLDNFTPAGTVSDEDAGTGFELLEGPFVSDVAADFAYEGACFTPEG